MHRAGKHAVAAAALLVAAAGFEQTAWAFHAGPTFDKPASAGGGEAIYYAGAAVDHGWTCTHCHENPAGQIKLHISQTELFTTTEQLPYTPGAQYKFDVDLIGEHLGIESPKANYNGIVIQVLNAEQQPAGSLLHSDDLVDTFGPSTLISAGIKPGATHWTFTWFAPGPTEGPDGGLPGPVTFYFAAVDGNGANSGPEGGEQDPFEDDVFTVAVPLAQGKAMTGANTAPPPAAPAAPHAADPSGPPRDEAAGRTAGVAAPMLASMLGLVMVGLSRRRRKR